MTELFSDADIKETPLELSRVPMERMNVAIVGHVDHGKSTIIGRLLADTNSLPKGKLEQIQEKCKRNSKPFEFSFLLDALKDEQAQGITIDTARVFFKSEKRKYIIIDTPGHIEFLRNVVTGASRAEAALLVIDANEGIQENSKRYCYMLSMLGIRQISILVNKMDLIQFSKVKFLFIVKEYSKFLEQLHIVPTNFIPISGKNGDNIASVSKNLEWYKGPNVLSQLDAFTVDEIPEDQPFRMPVQDIYKFTQNNDNRRIIAGTILTGKISVGDGIMFYPSKKRSKVKSIEGFNIKKQSVIGPGYATGLTIEDHLYIKRGELAFREDEKPPLLASRIVVNLFWLGKAPLQTNKIYFIKLGAQKIAFTLFQIKRAINASSLEIETKEEIKRNDVAECVLALKQELAYDHSFENQLNSRFVIIDDYEIAGGGIILDSLNNITSELKTVNESAEIEYEKSLIQETEREKQYNQKSSLILITGAKESRKKDIAKALEKELFENGHFVYYMSIGSLLYGLNPNEKLKTHHNHEDHIRRLAELANFMLDSGCILIVTAAKIFQADLDLMRKTLIAPEKLTTVWIGNVVFTDIKVDYHLFNFQRIKRGVKELKHILQDKKIINS